MDHILSDRDAQYRIDIPYLLQTFHVTQVDNGGSLQHGPSSSLPELVEFDLDDGQILSFHDFRLFSMDHKAAIIQAWLYFGLLRRFLGEAYHEDDFVRMEEDSESRFVSTENLPKAVKGLKPNSHDWIYLEHVMHQCIELDRVLDVDYWAETLLSIRVLAEYLVKCLGQWDTFARLFVISSSTFSVRPLQRLIVGRKAWCPLQFQRLCSRSDCNELYYLANLPRVERPWADHKSCSIEAGCVGLHIDNQTFLTHHVEAHCQCEHVAAPKHEMVRILNSGGFPVLRCTLRKGQMPYLTYEKASLGSKYVAISHLWSDGFGNPNGNSMPFCQLERLVHNIWEANAQMAAISALKVRQRILNTPFRQIAGSSMRSKRCIPRSYTVRFWFDVFCVPVIDRSPTLITPMHWSAGAEVEAPLDSEDVRNLKTLALERMAATYAWAEYVLVFNWEIMRLPHNLDEQELLAHLGISGWNTRCRTYQELCLAQRVVVLTKEGPRACRARENLAIHDRVMQDVRFFGEHWNTLVGKDTSQAGDTLPILAILLGLNASEVLRLSEADRMQAILKSRESLPLDILFTGVLKLRQRHVNSDRPHRPENGWVPSSPRGALYLEPTIEIVGLGNSWYRIKRHHLAAYGVMQPIDSRRHWCCTLTDEETGFHASMTITLNFEDGDTERYTNQGSGELFIAFNRSHMRVADSRRLVGICLHTKVLTIHTRARYLCSVECEVIEGQFEGPTLSLTPLPAGVEEVHLRCNQRRWANLTIRRGHEDDMQFLGRILLIGTFFFAWLISIFAASDESHHITNTNLLLLCGIFFLLWLTCQIFWIRLVYPRVYRTTEKATYMFLDPETERAPWHTRMRAIIPVPDPFKQSFWDCGVFAYLWFAIGVSEAFSICDECLGKLEYSRQATDLDADYLSNTTRASSSSSESEISVDT